MTIEQAKQTFRPQTAVENELLAECTIVAMGNGDTVADVLAAAVRWWQTAGKSIRPQMWRSRVEAARRLLARAATN